MTRDPAEPHPAAVPSTIPSEALTVQGRVAGVATRTMAALADLLVVALVVGGLYGGIALIRLLLVPSAIWPTGLTLSVPIVGFVLMVGYLTAGWRLTGRTYGCALVGLRVLTGDGERLPTPRALVRALLWAVFPPGVLWVAFSPTNRSLQDLLLHTKVVYDWTSRIAPARAGQRLDGPAPPP